MNGVSHPQARATISTGGAAKWVSVPPIETLTKSRPSVAYFSRGLGLEIVELPREEQRADRHRRRLGDERAEQRADGQDREPPRRRRAAAERGQPPQRALGERDDRPRRRERHDHDDEQRLGVGDAVVEVVLGAVPALGRASARPAARPPRARRRLRPRRGSAAARRRRSARRPAAQRAARASCRCCSSVRQRGEPSARRTCAGSPAGRCRSRRR